MGEEGDEGKKTLRKATVRTRSVLEKNMSEQLTNFKKV